MNLGREAETLEFKKSTGEPEEGVISIGAILNKHQKGELYFGVKADGSPIGQEISEKTLREISQAIANHTWWLTPKIAPESPQDEMAEKILSFCASPRSKKEIADYGGDKNAKSFAARYLKPLLESGQLQMTLPDKPNSSKQKYVKT